MPKVLSSLTMEMVCVEQADPNFAKIDPNIFKNPRVVWTMLQEENSTVPTKDYFSTVQTDISPFMRKIVTIWMLEVCEDLHCENQIFPLAVNFLDRFLCACTINRSQLQLSAAATLLLVAKIRQCQPISVRTLCSYTEDAITPQQLIQFETVIASKLNWALYGVTGSDFIDHIIERLPISIRTKCPLLRSHALTLVSLAYTESELIWTKPSAMACGAVMAAANGLNAGQDVATIAYRVTNANENHVRRVIDCVERCLSVSDSCDNNKIRSC